MKPRGQATSLVLLTVLYAAFGVYWVDRMEGWNWEQTLDQLRRAALNFQRDSCPLDDLLGEKPGMDLSRDQERIRHRIRERWRRMRERIERQLENLDGAGRRHRTL